MESLISLNGLSPEFIKIASVTREVWTSGSPIYGNEQLSKWKNEKNHKQ